MGSALPADTGAFRTRWPEYSTKVQDSQSVSVRHHSMPTAGASGVILCDRARFGTGAGGTPGRGILDSMLYSYHSPLRRIRHQGDRALIR